MRVLLANDDGVEAEGLAAARAALIAAQIKVVTVAPDTPRSGTARSATFRRSVSLQRHGGTDDNPIYSTDGTPTDTVRVAILSGTAGPIDAVVSGINEGANLGDDATYSSTLGAAIEGALLGYPSIAASQQARDGRFRLIDLSGYEFEPGAKLLSQLVQRLVADRESLPARSVLNLNSPARGPQGLRVAHLDERYWPPGSVFRAPGDPGWMIFGTHPDRDPAFCLSPGSDAWALSQGYAAVTPLSFKWSDGHARSQFSRWVRQTVDALNRELFTNSGSADE